nr:DsbA family protein [Vibrio natriegens]
MKLGLDPWVMLKAIQSAHYQSGLKVNEPSTLKSIAETLGLDTSDWDELMDKNQTVLINEIHSSQQLMSQLQVNGFPTLVVNSLEFLTRLITVNQINGRTHCNSGSKPLDRFALSAAERAISRCNINMAILNQTGTILAQIFTRADIHHALA